MTRAKLAITEVSPKPSRSLRVLMASCLSVFLQGSFFYSLVREQLYLMRQKQAALESLRVIAVPGSSFLDGLGWSGPLYASLFYLVVLGMMFFGFLLISLVFRSSLKRATFLVLGILAVAVLTYRDRVFGSLLMVAFLSFGSFYFLTLSSRIQFTKKELFASLLVVVCICLSLFFGSKQRFFLKARDRVLFDSAIGNKVVSYYYQYSPLAAALITPEKGIYQSLVLDTEIKDGNIYYLGQGIFVAGNEAIAGKTDFEISREGDTASLTSRYGEKAEISPITPQSVERGIGSLFSMKGFVRLNSIGLYAFPGGLLILITFSIKGLTNNGRAFFISLGCIGILMVSFIWIVSLTGNRNPDASKPESRDEFKQELALAYFLDEKNEVPSLYGPAIKKMIRSESPVLRYWGVHLLGVGGNMDEVEKVKQLLEDPVPNVRYTAARSLYRLMHKESLNLLIGRLLSDPSWYVRCKVYSLFLEAGMIPSPA